MHKKRALCSRSISNGSAAKLVKTPKVELDIEPMLEESLSEIKTPSASSACFLLAFLEYEAAGVASLRVRYLISMDYT